MSDIIESIVNICVILLCIWNLTIFEAQKKRIKNLEKRLDLLGHEFRTAKYWALKETDHE